MIRRLVVVVAVLALLASFFQSARCRLLLEGESRPSRSPVRLDRDSIGAPDYGLIVAKVSSVAWLPMAMFFGHKLCLYVLGRCIEPPPELDITDDDRRLFHERLHGQCSICLALLTEPSIFTNEPAPLAQRPFNSIPFDDEASTVGVAISKMPCGIHFIHHDCKYEWLRNRDPYLDFSCPECIQSRPVANVINQ